MYTIQSTPVRINGKIVPTSSCTVRNGDTVLSAEAGATECTAGGRRDCRALLSLVCEKGELLFVPVKDRSGRVVGMDLAACGEEALLSILDALDFFKTRGWFVISLNALPVFLTTKMPPAACRNSAGGLCFPSFLNL